MTSDINVDLGYVFHPSPSPFGSEQVEITLRAEPTHLHFDPKLAHLSVGAVMGVETISIHHPWHDAQSYQLAPGTIRVFDWKRKELEVFTFGGQVEVASSPDHTTLTLTSPAPLLELADNRPLTLMFFDEIEILLAEARARLMPHATAEFEGKLLTADPFLFYVACLDAIHKKMETFHTPLEGTRQHFKHALADEIKRLQTEDKWPLFVLSLADLLAKN